MSKHVINYTCSPFLLLDISETFNIFNEAKLPIEFFDGLSELLLYHAIKNENLRAQKNIYCEILSKILSSTNMMGTPTYNAALRNLLVLTRGLYLLDIQKEMDVLR
jgi:hypothetical protein